MTSQGLRCTAKPSAIFVAGHRLVRRGKCHDGNRLKLPWILGAVGGKPNAVVHGTALGLHSV